MPLPWFGRKKDKEEEAPQRAPQPAASAKATPRLYILGLDGTPETFIRAEIAKGRLPNFARILGDGQMIQMDSSWPFVSSVAWTNFMTGKQPGKHNIYGFIDREPGAYKFYLPNSVHMKADTVWEILSRAGKRVCSINVPLTYPSRQINGILIADFLSPKLNEKAVYPPSLLPELQTRGYRIDADAKLAKTDTLAFIRDVNEVLDRRIEAAEWLYKKEPWDFFMCHVMETDRLHHFCYEFYDTNDPVYGPEFLKFYDRLDAYVGKIYDSLAPDTTFMMLSDHGFCTLRHEVQLNAYLVENGWLALDPNEKRPFVMPIVPAETKAYSLDPGRVFINLAGREPGGSVQPGEEYERVREAVRQDILNMKDPNTGEPMVAEVHKREDLYTGPYYNAASDLVVLPHRGYEFKGSFTSTEVLDKSHNNGMHTFDDCLFYVQDHAITPGRHAIEDVMPSILKLLEVGVPGDVDGKVIVEEV